MTDRIEPFMIGVDSAALDDLGDRLRRARWPERETVADQERSYSTLSAAISSPLMKLKCLWPTRCPS